MKTLLLFSATGWLGVAIIIAIVVIYAVMRKLKIDAEVNAQVLKEQELARIKYQESLKKDWETSRTKPTEETVEPIPTFDEWLLGFLLVSTKKQSIQGVMTRYGYDVTDATKAVETCTKTNNLGWDVSKRRYCKRN